jgi:hypothetical protein
MGGYSAIATGAGTIDVMAEFWFCNAKYDRSDCPGSARLTWVYTVEV